MTPRIADAANLSRADKSPDNHDGPLWYSDPTGHRALENMRGVCVINFESSDVTIYISADEIRPFLIQNFRFHRTRKGHIRAEANRAA